MKEHMCLDSHSSSDLLPFNTLEKVIFQIASPLTGLKLTSDNDLLLLALNIHLQKCLFFFFFFFFCNRARNGFCCGVAASHVLNPSKNMWVLILDQEQTGSLHAPETIQIEGTIQTRAT